jgi:hypothetical protein
VRINEAETNTAYERAVKFSGLPSNTQHVLQRSLEESGVIASGFCRP